MIVHSYDAWNHRIPTKIQLRCARVRRAIRALLHGGDLSGFNDDVLILDGGRSRTVNDPNVPENNPGSTYPDKLLYRFR
jgi:hypothetical protein